MIYLATPYTHPSLYVRTLRYTGVTKAAAFIMNSWEDVFSPITNGHPMQMNGVDKWGMRRWLDYDKQFFDICDKLWVLMLPGWDQSPGVAKEMGWAADSKKLTTVIRPHVVGVPDWVMEGLRKHDGLVEE